MAWGEGVEGWVKLAKFLVLGLLNFWERRGESNMDRYNLERSRRGEEHLLSI